MINKLPKLYKESRIFILTGAGISQESGIKTFRDQNGLWNNHKIQEVATLDGFKNNPQLVYKFYNDRRRELNHKNTKANKAHTILSNLEKYININIITQNIDNLHEKAGSSNVIYMHGELNKVRCVNNEKHIFNWIKDLNENHKCNICDSHMRPHICWFGEMPYKMDKIHHLAYNSDLFVSIGTSGEVYPAAGFVNIFKEMKKPTIELNLEPSRNNNQFDYAIYKPATIAVKEFKDIIIDNINNY
tara:strand:- start:1407 stop:2141 length:735 start_codon:yes stop_codon:yes gene_type:complete